MKIVEKQISKDNITIKYLLQTKDEHIIEVSYFEFEERIICISTQIGCPMGCIFCASTEPLDEVNPKKRFIRNLDRDEIADEISLIEKDSRNYDNESKGILLSFMGMGEPYLNFENVLGSIREASKYLKEINVTIASSGIRPDLIKELAKERFDFPVRAQLSLHASNNAKRKAIMPNAGDIKEALDAVYYFAKTTGQNIKVNYVLISGMNDTEEDAHELAKLMEPYKDWLIVKLMELNEIKDLKASDDSKFQLFKNILDVKDVKNVKFVGDGKDIKGTCGQSRRHYYKRRANV